MAFSVAFSGSLVSGITAAVDGVALFANCFHPSALFACLISSLVSGRVDSSNYLTENADSLIHNSADPKASNLLFNVVFQCRLG